MRVELSADLFDDTDDTDLIDSINGLFRCFLAGRHDLVVDGPTAAAAERFFAGHLPKHAKKYAALVRGAPNRVAWTGTSQRAGAKQVCLVDAVASAADLCQPAKLVLENGESDRCFVVAVAHVFGHRRIVKAIGERWLEIEQAGGSGEIHKVARAAAERFRRWRRVVALYDSDRWLPGTRFEHEEHAEELRREKVTVHVLLLREAENYVPHKVIAASGRRYRVVSRKLGHLRKLSVEQRGHFDMKHGFREGLRRGAPHLAFRPEQADLFHGIPPEVRLGLDDGFGQDLLKHLFTHRAALCERDFDHLGPAAVADLRAMLDAITSQI